MAVLLIVHDEYLSAYSASRLSAVGLNVGCYWLGGTMVRLRWYGVKCSEGNARCCLMDVLIVCSFLTD